MSADIGRPCRVLAVLDDSETQIALKSAAALADRHGATLEVMTCVEPPHDLGIIARLSGRDPDRLIDALVARAERDARAHLAAVLPDRGLVPRVAVGKAFFEIIRHVAETGCDFVVKTAEPLSATPRFLFASTDQHLLRKCPCPVWLQTPTAPVAPRRVLAAVDLDVWDADEPETLMALNRHVLDAAIGIAAGPEAEVAVLHAWDAVGEGMVWAFSSDADTRMALDRYVNEVLDSRQQAMRRFLAGVEKDGASRPRLVPRLVRGTPERVIEEQSRQSGAEVVVMGTVARTGIGGVFIGNTAENIINSLECPVLAVKPDGFVSPLL